MTRHSSTRSICRTTAIDAAEVRVDRKLAFGRPPGALVLRNDGLLHRFIIIITKGIVHRGLSEDTVAVTGTDEPALFDLLASRSTRADEHPEWMAGDVADLTELAKRWGPVDGLARLRSRTPSSVAEFIECLA